MQAALQTLKNVRADSRSILVAGDMLELGLQAESLHKKIGTLAAASGLQRIYVTGNYARDVISGARQAHMRAENIFNGSRDQILADLKTYLKSGDWVLVKGSRGMTMEKIVRGLRQWTGMPPSV
jgi:UDP-N-acetylmuramoyl-tripeptide--D-alanyl-D-alanine ligase